VSGVVEVRTAHRAPAFNAMASAPYACWLVTDGVSLCVHVRSLARELRTLEPWVEPSPSRGDNADGTHHYWGTRCSLDTVKATGLDPYCVFQGLFCFSFLLVAVGVPRGMGMRLRTRMIGKRKAEARPAARACDNNSEVRNHDAKYRRDTSCVCAQETSCLTRTRW
jgi:hypothetical protein